MLICRAECSITACIAARCIVVSGFVLPAGQSTQALLPTYLFAAQSVASQVVAEPDASSSAAFVLPAGQSVQTWLFTYLFATQSVASQVVSLPDASSLAAFVLPDAQATQ